jgi:capsular polysaccharide biosynthesis protein
MQTRGRRKIYVSRVSKNRHLLNQNQVESALAAEGFEVLRCDDLDLDTQIRIFSEAEIVISPTGAQVANIVWCPPEAKVIVLASDHPHHQLYLWSLLGRVSGASVEFIQGPRAYNLDGEHSVHDDYTVDVGKILSRFQSAVNISN